MLPVQSPDILGRVFLENFLGRDAFAGSGPHVSHVNILGAVLVEVGPANAHARTDVFNTCLRSHIRKGSIAIVTVKILTPEIIHHVKVGPSISVVIAPAAAETVTRVVLIKARLRSHVTERSVAVVPHHEIRRAILGVMIGDRIFVLIGALIINVETKINIQPAVAVIIGDGRAGECSLWNIGELKRSRFLAKCSAALVQEQERSARTHDYNILKPVIIEVCKERTRRIVEDPKARGFGDVFKSTISTISIKAVGKTRGLANIEVVEAIVINVGD